MNIISNESVEFNQTIFYFENDTSVTICNDTLEVTDSDGLAVVPQSYLDKIEREINQKIKY